MGKLTLLVRKVREVCVLFPPYPSQRQRKISGLGDHIGAIRFIVFGRRLVWHRKLYYR